MSVTFNFQTHWKHNFVLNVHGSASLLRLQSPDLWLGRNWQNDIKIQFDFEMKLCQTQSTSWKTNPHLQAIDRRKQTMWTKIISQFRTIEGDEKKNAAGTSIESGMRCQRKMFSHNYQIRDINISSFFDSAHSMPNWRTTIQYIGKLKTIENRNERLCTV